MLRSVKSFNPLLLPVACCLVFTVNFTFVRLLSAIACSCTILYPQRLKLFP
ncbi:MAG: hypothetical protein AB4426_14375 [Xenococcaceae cyanobacterium]